MPMYLCRQGDREHAGGARAACCDCGVPSRCAQRCRGETLAHRPAAAHARREPRAAAAAVRRPCPLASGQYPLLGPLRAGAPVIGPRPAPKSTTHSVEPLLSRSRPSCADRPLLKSASDGSMPSALPPAPCIGLLERLEGRSDGLRPPQPALSQPSDWYRSIDCPGGRTRHPLDPVPVFGVLPLESPHTAKQV